MINANFPIGGKENLPNQLNALTRYLERQKHLMKVEDWRGTIEMHVQTQKGIEEARRFQRQRILIDTFFRLEQPEHDCR